MTREITTSDLKRLILDFIQDVKDNISTTNEERGDMMLVEFFFKQLHPDMVLYHVINALLPHKDKVIARTEGFFMENRFLFSGLPGDRVEYYVNHIKNGYINAEDRKVIYEYFDTIIAMAEILKKKK